MHFLDLPIKLVALPLYSLDDYLEKEKFKIDLFFLKKGIGKISKKVSLRQFHFIKQVIKFPDNLLPIYR